MALRTHAQPQLQSLRCAHTSTHALRAPVSAPTLPSALAPTCAHILRRMDPHLPLFSRRASPRIFARKTPAAHASAAPLATRTCRRRHDGGTDDCIVFLEHELEEPVLILSCADGAIDGQETAEDDLHVVVAEFRTRRRLRHPDVSYLG
eukprot:6189002-Pleurochrysis_carterae.AAC.1